MDSTNEEGGREVAPSHCVTILKSSLQGGSYNEPSLAQDKLRYSSLNCSSFCHQAHHQAGSYVSPCPPPFFLLAFSYFLVPQDVPDSYSIFPAPALEFTTSPSSLIPFLTEWCLDVKEKHTIVFLYTTYNTLNTSIFYVQMCGGFSIPRTIPCHHLGVLQFNSILAQSTWRQSDPTG